MFHFKDLACGNGAEADDKMRRMYVAIMLHQVIQGDMSVWAIARQFEMERGAVQKLVSAAAANAHSLIHFTHELKV